MAHAFSAKALEEQQPLISKHMGTLVHQQPIAEGPQDMSERLNFAGFDIIGDLAFGVIQMSRDGQVSTLGQLRAQRVQGSNLHELTQSLRSPALRRIPHSQGLDASERCVLGIHHRTARETAQDQY